MGGKLIIVNLQKTKLDKYACLVIHARCDDVTEMLMKKLNIAVPEFRIQKWLKVSLKQEA
jgi:mono-ADP-ribosyltransferase sirtuin 6